MSTPPRNTLIIPSKTQVCEIDAKLILACAAAERGFSSIIGARHDIRRKIGSLPRGVYIGKDIRGSSLRKLRIMANLGCQLLARDEEALVT